ncbi:MAG: rhodanese-like domain-containing protein [Deltaproteobacteria bacterium]
MKKLGLIVAALAAVAILGCSNATNANAKNDPHSEPTAANLKSMTVDEVAAKIATNDGKTLLFDANPKEVWVNGHVPGAKWIDDEHVTADQLPAAKDALMIFYCYNES